METKADEVYASHLRLGRFLPLPVVVVLSLVRGIVVGALGGTTAAPAWVVVTCRSTGREAGRLSAGREPYVGEALLRSVQVSMSELSPADFLRRWHLDQS